VSSDPFKSRYKVRQALLRERIGRRHTVVGNARPKLVVSRSVHREVARRRVAVALDSVHHKVAAPPVSVLAVAVASGSVLAAAVSVLEVVAVNARSVVADSVAGSVAASAEDQAVRVVDRCAVPRVMARR